MNFYFCETCGRRLTDADIARGEGRNKKLKGVFCASCSVGVMTQEMQAIDPDDLPDVPVKHNHDKPPIASAKPAGRASRAVAIPPPAPADPRAATRSATTAELPAMRPTSRPGRAAGGSAKGTQPSNPLIPIAIVGAIVVIGGIAALSSRSNSGKPGAVADNAKKKASEQIQPDNHAVSSAPAPAVPVIAPFPEVLSLAPAPPVVDAKTTTADSAKPEQPENAVVDHDALAQKAFETMAKACEALPQNDKDGRIALAKSFLNDFGETILAARARVMLRQWTDPPPPPPAVQAAPLAASTVLPANAKRLATANWDAFEGGCPQVNFWNAGKTGRSIWGKKSQRGSMKSTLKLDTVPADAATLVVHSLRHERPQPCSFLIKINGTEIFKGVDPATNYSWTDHAFTIPAGLLKVGANEVYFENTEPDGYDSQLPWYMINYVYIADVPPAGK